MPANRVIETVHIGQRADIEQMNESSLPRGGELGDRLVTVGNKEYQIVVLDSGAVAANPRGVVADGHLAFWQSKANFRVTNDIRTGLGAEDATLDNKRNFVAGVFTTAATAGNYCVIQLRGRHANVISDGGGDFTIGDLTIVANSTTASVDRMAAGTAPTHTTVGRVAAAESGGFTALDLELPEVP